jgi:NAD(P)H-nitrite reductase large subunit
MHITIIGNGPAALSSICAIRKWDRQCEITVVSKENEPPYSPCFLAKYVCGETTRERLYLKDRRFYVEHRINALMGTSAMRIDTAGSRVVLSNGKALPYDRLMIAAGASPMVPEIPGITGEGVFTLKTVFDADRIIKKAKASRNAVIIGSGYIALEIAEALKKAGLSVTLVARKDRILRRMLDSETTGIVMEHVIKNGVNIITKNEVRSVERSRIKKTLKKVILSSGEAIACDMLVVAIGVRPNLGMTAGSPIRTGHGIITDGAMRTSVPGIYAAGDIAETEIQGTRKLNPIHINAVSCGEIAGANMVGMNRALDSHIYDMNVLTVFGMQILSLGSYETGLVLRRDDSRSMVRISLKDSGQIAGVRIIGDVAKGGLFLSLMKKGIPADEIPGILSPRFHHGATLRSAWTSCPAPVVQPG